MHKTLKDLLALGTVHAEMNRIMENTDLSPCPTLNVHDNIMRSYFHAGINT